MTNVAKKVKELADCSRHLGLHPKYVKLEINHGLHCFPSLLISYMLCHKGGSMIRDTIISGNQKCFQNPVEKFGPCKVLEKRRGLGSSLGDLSYIWPWRRVRCLTGLF